MGRGEKPCLQTSCPHLSFCFGQHLLCGSTPAGQLPPWSNSSQVASVVEVALIGQPQLPESGSSISSFGLSSPRHYSGFLQISVLRCLCPSLAFLAPSLLLQLVPHIQFPLLMTWHLPYCFHVWTWVVWIVFHPNNILDLASQPNDGILSSHIWSLKLVHQSSFSKTKTWFENEIDWFTTPSPNLPPPPHPTFLACL